MKFSTLSLPIFGSLVSSFAKADSTVNRRAAVKDYVLDWDGCDKALGDISATEQSNIFCDYTILPADDTYRAELFGWTGVKGDACEGDKPPMVNFTDSLSAGLSNPFQSNPLFDPHTTNSRHSGITAEDGEFHTDIDIDRSKFMSGGGEETFHFCIRHDVMEDLDGDGTSETSMYFLKTFITVRFFLNGNFELNADSEGPLGEDDDVVYTGDDDVLFPGNDNVIGNDDGGGNFNNELFGDDDPSNGGGINVTENLTASEVFDEFNKTYSVFAYQCELTFPHDQTDEIIYQGDNLGICVETLFRDTFIAKVLELELIQDDANDGLYTTQPVTVGNPNVVTETDCALNSRIGEDLSKCFIKTAMLSQFFITQLVVNATGEVDLKIRTTPTNPNSNRLLVESRFLQSGIDGTYTVNARLGAPDIEANAVSVSMRNAVCYGMMVGILSVSLLLL